MSDIYVPLQRQATAALSVVLGTGLAYGRDTTVRTALLALLVRARCVDGGVAFGCNHAAGARAVSQSSSALLAACCQVCDWHQVHAGIDGSACVRVLVIARPT